MADADACDTPTGETTKSAAYQTDGNHTQYGEQPVQDDFGLTLAALLDDLQEVAILGPNQLLVVGASSSEVIGQRIGTATSMHIGRQLVAVIQAFAAKTGCFVAFQCCEHLNRSLVVERTYAALHHLPEVQAIPVPGAGGAVASAAFFAMASPCLVSSVEADAGIDIGDTFIGMHLKQVAVPVRGRTRQIGEAHVTMARCRPPLVGGARAIYNLDTARQFLEQRTTS